ncbi:ABC transporter substrate-binding protein [Desulfoplanes sp. PS50]
MSTFLKRLLPALFLIALASAVLLVSDLGHRQSSRLQTASLPKIAIMQITSTPLIDLHVSGIIERLEDNGFVASDQGNLHLYNPQGDIPTANAIGREIVSRGYDMVITSSTIALQVVANANKGVGMTHVFGAVTDPLGAGVGITGRKLGEHPPYLAGIGTFQPVTRVFEIARELCPGLEQVGVVWNPGEQCSEACMLEARAVCNRLGMDLVEATAGNTSEVNDSLRSLLIRDIQALWIGGDTVAQAAAGMIFKLTAQAGVPVFTNDPEDVHKGAILGLGADYKTVGRYTGDMAVAILKGRNPSSFPIDNVVPERLEVNETVLARFADSWTMTDSIRALVRKGHKGIVRARYNGPARVAMINLTNSEVLDQAEQGVEKGLGDRGLVPGEDYVLTRYNAQGDMALVPQMIDTATTKGADLLVTVTTPVLMAAAKQVEDLPVVFTVASDPRELGIFPNGRPGNICGVHDDPQLGALTDMLLEYDSHIHRVGIIYSPAQRNAVISVERLRRAGRERNLTILEATASNTSELSMGVQSLIDRGMQGLIISADNVACAGFPVIHKMTSKANIPIFTTNGSLIRQGATGCVGDDYFSWGRQSGHLAADILFGGDPMDLPIEGTRNQVVIHPQR